MTSDRAHNIRIAVWFLLYSILVLFIGVNLGRIYAFNEVITEIDYRIATVEEDPKP